MVVTPLQAIDMDPAHARLMVAYMVGYHQTDAASHPVNAAVSAAWSATVNL